MHSSDSPTAHRGARRSLFTEGLYAPYFVYRHDAPPEEGVGVVVAASSREAVHEATGTTAVLCSAALSPGSKADDLHDDPWQVVCLADGRRYLIGRGRWPTKEDVSHAAIWASLEADVRERVEAHWRTFGTCGASDAFEDAARS